VLKVSGPKDWVNEFILKAEGIPPKWTEGADRDKELLCFNSFIPVPENVLKVGFCTVDEGRIDGYAWSIENWGTKWECYEITREEGKKGTNVTYCFNTAWSPPIPVIKKMAKLFPQLRFSLWSREGGEGYQFRLILKGNETIKEETKNYSGSYGG